MPVHYSASTWQQPAPRPVSPERSRLVERVARRILARGDGRLRVAIDGRTAAGKTSFGHELAEYLDAFGRPVLRATLDDFKRPWAERYRYDRTSGEGYYRNAYDYESLRRLLLDPHRSEAGTSVALCSIDPLTQQDHSAVVTTLEADAVLIVDGVFAFRPEINEYWDYRIWLEVHTDLSVQRGIERDGRSGTDPASERYRVSEDMYVQEVDPVTLADVAVDNSVLVAPRLLEPGGCAPSA